MDPVDEILAAIDMITEQGEGAPANGLGTGADFQNEQSHYGRFAELHYGRRYRAPASAVPITAENEARRHKDYARERLRGRSGPAEDLHCEWSGGGMRTQVDKDAAVERLIDLGEEVPTRRTRSPRTIRVTRTGARTETAPGEAA